MRALLSGEGGDFDALDRARVALRAHPWCWPDVEPLRTAAERLAGCARPASPRGGALLVAVKGNGKVGNLWALRPVTAEVRHEHLLTPLRGAAHHSQLLAERLAARDLPIMLDASALVQPVRWGATLVWQGDTREADTSLDGPSYGAAQVLAYASLLAEHASLPTDLVASAALAEDGSLLEVGDIALKLRIVADSAPGVRRFIVAKGQEEEARAASATLPPDRRLAVIGCRTTADLLAVAFPSLGEAPPSAWRAPEKAREAARHLFRICLLGDQPILGWDKLERSAEYLERCLPPEGEEAWLNAFSRQVAARHHGRAPVQRWPSDPRFEALPAVVRQMYRAHVLQSATEGEAAELQEYLRLAIALLPPHLGDDHEGDLRLRGAVGRALARRREWGPAAATLQAAVSGWFGLFRAHEASVPLCELARVRGLQRDLAGVRELEVAAARIRAEAECHFMSRAFMQLAIGRGLVQAGAPADGLSLLAPRDFGTVRPHVRDAAYRWRARALSACGEVRAAAACRAELASLSPSSHATLLSVVDEARERGDLTAAAAAADDLCAAEGAKVRLLLSGCPSPEERIRLIADEYPL